MMACRCLAWDFLFPCVFISDFDVTSCPVVPQSCQAVTQLKHSHQST
uniref:FZ domain-containing protein n=1 Tax=Anguilla anguilla TaxID=7936 RepID=A0A0E9RKZ5_ANGAN